MISTLGNQNVLIIIFIFFVSFISAQSTDQFYHKNPHHVLSGDDIVLSVTMFTSDPIVSGMLFFRSKNQISYQRRQHRLLARRARQGPHGRALVRRARLRAHARPPRALRQPHRHQRSPARPGHGSRHGLRRLQRNLSLEARYQGSRPQPS